MLKVLIVNKLDIKIARDREIRKDSFIPEHCIYSSTRSAIFELFAYKIASST